VAPIEITTELVLNQPPTSGRFLIPDSGQAPCSQLTNCVQQCLLQRTNRKTHLSFMQEFNIGSLCMKVLILNCTGAEASPSPPWASMPDGPAAPSVFNATDRTCGPLSVRIRQDGDHRVGSQRRQSWTDQQIWLRVFQFQ